MTQPDEGTRPRHDHDEPGDFATCPACALNALPLGAVEPHVPLQGRTLHNVMRQRREIT